MSASTYVTAGGGGPVSYRLGLVAAGYRPGLMLETADAAKTMPLSPSPANVVLVGAGATTRLTLPHAEENRHLEHAVDLFLFGILILLLVEGDLVGLGIVARRPPRITGSPSFRVKAASSLAALTPRDPRAAAVTPCPMNGRNRAPSGNVEPATSGENRTPSHAI